MEENLALKAYLQKNALNPYEYVIEKFKNHDVILLAETHAIKENLLFLQSIIPELYKAGIYNVGMEFGASEDQEALDALVTAQYFDEEKARELMFNYNVIHPYKEYWGVYKAAWTLNHSLHEGAPRFRVLNMSYKYNWKGYKGIRTPETYRKVFYKGGTERYRAAIIEKEILQKNEKILILTGNVHAFTKYRYPVFDSTEEDFIRLADNNLGNLLYKKVPEKVFSIALHYMFFSQEDESVNRLPADGKIEELMEERGNKPLGFDLIGTPMGQLQDHSYYALGHPDFTLQDLVDGYIFLKPLMQQKGCTIDYDFLKKHTLQEVLDQFPDPEWHKPPENLKDYWRLVEDFVNMKKRYGNIQNN